MKQIFQAILLTMMAAYCAKAGDRPNILLLVSEDNGPHLGCYGDPYARTPNLDRLGAAGVIFERAYVTQAGCSPSRASIFTGTYPHENGQIGLATHGFRFYEEDPFIFINALKKSGYRTSVLGKIHVNPESAIAVSEKIEGDSFRQRDVKGIAERALEFITKDDEPFFLMVNYADAHRPFLKQQGGLPEDPYNKEDVEVFPYIGFSDEMLKEQTANYYNSMERLDAGIGMLINQLKKTDKYKNTVIIYLGDHGADLVRGKRTSYEGGTRIPLIVTWPDQVKAGQRLNELISTIDLAPTFLELAGIKQPKFLHGKSLMPLVQEKKTDWREYLFTEYHVHSPHNLYPQRTVRNDKYKLIINLLHGQENPGYTYTLNIFFDNPEYVENILAHGSPMIKKAYAEMKVAPKYELYDLEHDPYEFNNLANNAAYSSIFETLKAELLAWRIATADPLLEEHNLQSLKKQVDDCFSSGKYKRKSMDYWTFYDIWQTYLSNL